MMKKKYYAIMMILLFGSINMLFSDVIHKKTEMDSFHDMHEILIPFNVFNSKGNLVLSDSLMVHISDSPLTITKKLQHHAMEKFKTMSDDERTKIGGSPDYGLDAQRWEVYQNNKSFKISSKTQSLIDNYDRFNKKYHEMPFKLIYFMQDHLQ